MNSKLFVVLGAGIVIIACSLIFMVAFKPPVDASSLQPLATGELAIFVGEACCGVDTTTQEVCDGQGSMCPGGTYADPSACDGQRWVDDCTGQQTFTADGEGDYELSSNIDCSTAKKGDCDSEAFDPNPTDPEEPHQWKCVKGQADDTDKVCGSYKTREDCSGGN